MAQTQPSCVLGAALLSLRAIVDEGSLSAAEKLISRSQSTLSKHISKLDDSLQFHLFKRISRLVRQSQVGGGVCSLCQASSVTGR